ncbi:MAG TPA: hypothetical protein GXX25_02215 [Desulfotomaculum sp.]|nr:hypothetical protein [Desulfotomaculum sp.]
MAIPTEESIKLPLLKVIADAGGELPPKKAIEKRVIKPGSVGLAIRNDNQEYLVEKVFYNPKSGQLCYSGRYISQQANDTCAVIWPISDVAEIPGESNIGFYDYETGEIT